MPYGEAHFDKVYAIEATCHAQSLYKIYSEVFRVLKPGGLFALYEWIMTDVYNPSDPYHKKLKADILVSFVICLGSRASAAHRAGGGSSSLLFVSVIFLLFFCSSNCLLSLC